jgi:peptidyl-prolyl cis-trans isomerase D
MLDMLRSKTKIFLWIVAVAFIVSIGAGTIFGRRRASSAAQQKQGLVGVVNGTPIQYRDFAEAYRQNVADYAKQSGAEVSEATRDAIREQTWNSMVTDILVTSEIRRLGIDVPDDVVFDVLWSSPPQSVYSAPAFQDENGQFDFDAYHREIQMHPERWDSVAEYYRSQLQRQILQREIQSAAMVSDNELWEEFVARNEKVRVAFVGIDPRRIDREPLMPTEEEARAYFSKHREDYRRPATVVLSFVDIPKVATREDEDDIVMRLQELAQAVRDGEDFAELARVYSEGPSAAEGGNLGFFGRGAMVKEFEDVAFGLDVGQVSEPFKTSFGYHIVQVTDKRVEDGEPQVEARQILIKVRPSEETLVGLEEQLDELSDLTKREGLANAADALGYEMKSTEPFPDGRNIPAIGSLGPAVKAAFAGKVGDDIGPYATDEAYYMFEIAKKNKSTLPTYDEIAESLQGEHPEHPAVTALIMELQGEKAAEIAGEIESAVRAGSTLEDAASEAGYSVVQSQQFSRRDYVPGAGRDNAFIGTSFGLRPGETSGVVKVDQPERYFVIRVEEKTPADESQFTDQESQLRTQLLQREQMQVFSAWLEDVMSEAKIEDYRDTYF